MDSAGQSKCIITDFNSHVLSITEREVLKSTVIVDLWIYSFGSLHFTSHILILLLDACTFIFFFFLENFIIYLFFTLKIIGD